MPTFDFEVYVRDFDRKAAAAKPAVEGLYRDGKPINAFADTHKAAIERHLAPARQSGADVIELANRADAHARTLEASQHADPLSSLTTDELIRLNAARELAKDEIGKLTRQELGGRLATVAASSDRVSQVLHVLYAKPAVDEAGDSSLHEQLAAVDNAAFGKERAAAAKAVEEAAALRKQAAEARFHVGYTLAEIDGSNQAALDQRLAAYGGAF
jgi:hypothetical protein